MAPSAPTPPTSSPSPQNSGNATSIKLKQFRPDHDRSVEVFGEFNEELAHNLLSKISELRAVSREPITVYINSIGGSVAVMRFLRGILDTRDLDGNFCRTITVVVGCAASAGANLLAFGDYAYAYEHSIIHFHGVRASDLPERFEDAAQLTSQLAATQRDVSRSLAQSIVRRVLFRFADLKANFNLRRHDITSRQLIGLKCFVDEIKKHLSPSSARLIDKTFGNVEKALLLTQKIIPKVPFRKRGNPSKDDANVLIEVIRYEVKSRHREWRIDDNGIQQVIHDYFVLSDFHLGDHWLTCGHLVKAYGVEFLTNTELVKYKRLESKNNDKALKFLHDKAFPHLEPLWYYTVSLCRTLFSGENRLSPEDAYWMGIIDEVIGTPLTGFRVVAEKGPRRRKLNLLPLLPTRLRRLPGNLRLLHRRKLRCPCLSTFEAAQPAQRDGGGVFDGLRGWRLSRHLLNNGKGRLIQVFA